MSKNMTPEVYEKKRNDLIGLFEESVERIDDQAEVTKKALGGICEATCKRMNDIAEDLRRNCFEIVLVGEFQGGKSTTFDAICDGREISPRGIGIKTSACRISAQSVPKTEDECAILNWKSDDELMLTMYELVRDNVADDEEGARLFPHERPDKLPSLSDRHVRELAKRAIAREWEIYRQVPGAYGGEEGDGRLDLLKMATLILKYHGTPELDRHRKMERIGIEELKPFVVFPHDWAVRWQKEGENTFWSLTESAFAFLGSIDCHIHSPNLERLGCVVTDCPGLFAGPWDTKIAQQAMMRADAILYLMRGDKTIGDEDMKALRHIIQLRQGDKLFFAINARGDVPDNDLGITSVRQNVIENLRGTDFSKIEGIGVKNVKGAEDLEVFNALLAFKSKEKPGEGEDASNLWRKDVTNVLQTYLGLDFFDDDGRRKIMELIANRKKLEAASDFPAILRKIETDITSRKFETILVDRGTQQLSNALGGIEGELRGLEDTAEGDLERIKRAIELARMRLTEFQRFVVDGMREILNESGDAEYVCRDCYESVFTDNIGSYANEVSSTIAQKLRNIGNIASLAGAKVANGAKRVGNFFANVFRVITFQEKKKFVPDDTKFREILGGPIRSTMCQVATEGITGWVVGVSQERNRVFSMTYGRSLKRLQKEIEERWEKTVKGDDFWCHILGAVNMDSARIGTMQGTERILGGDVESREIKDLVYDFAFWTALLLLVWGVVLGSWDRISSLFDHRENGGFGRLFETLLKSSIEPKLRQPLTNAFSDRKNKEEVVGKLDETVLRHILDRILKNCQNALADQRKRFEENVERLLATYELALEERRRIAAIAKEVRETVIAPMQHKADAFNEELLPYFKGEEV